MKEKYRKKYLALRNNLSNKDKRDLIIYNKVINNQKIMDSDLILTYVSMGSEVDTLKIIDYLHKFKKVAVPKIVNNNMNFYIINSINDLDVGYFNILEPINGKLVTNFDNCVSITPGICYSADGYRIGYGKGYYDKFYSKYKNIYKIGLCYKEFLLDKMPNDSFDIKVDEIITDNVNL